MTTRRSGRRPRVTVPPEGHEVPPEGHEVSLILPAWRRLLESRWQQRLGTVIRLSLAYHDASERSDSGHHPPDQAESRYLQRLMLETVTARRALAETEEALGRLSAGQYGRCEQCAAGIPSGRLAAEPEARYCERCCVRGVALVRHRASDLVR
jgi:RNA polymerase-binding transcription factor DksA